MDYKVNINGVDILIEQNEDSKNRSHLLEYYRKLLQAKGVELDSDKYKALETTVENMTETSAKEKLDGFDPMRMEQIIFYAKAFGKLNKTESATVDALMEVLDASLADGNLAAIFVNGNRFTYEKDSVDVSKYMEKLYAIGEEKKGNTWTIYVDEEGELVIY